MKLLLRMAPATALLFTAYLAVDTATQLAFKSAAEFIGDVPLSLDFLYAVVKSPWAWLAVVLYIATYVLWMGVLKGSTLSRAFPLTALSYVTVPLLAWMIFDEAVGVRTGVGILLILAGLMAIGEEAETLPSDFSDHEPPPSQP